MIKTVYEVQWLDDFSGWQYDKYFYDVAVAVEHFKSACDRYPELEHRIVVLQIYVPGE